MLLSNTGDGEAARGSRKSSLVLDEIERLPRGKGILGIDPKFGLSNLRSNSKVLETE